tara:strand:+ start:201 stop:422 length:222 start_codon:yes stop_codon:yes gene_type:complete
MKVDTDELICSATVSGANLYSRIFNRHYRERRGCRNKKVTGIRGGLPMCWIHEKQFDEGRQSKKRGGVNHDNR